MIDSRRGSRQSPLSLSRRQQISPKSEDNSLAQKGILYQQSQQGNRFQDYYCRKDNSDEHEIFSANKCPLRVIDAFSQAKQPSLQEQERQSQQQQYISPKKSQRDNTIKETTHHPIFFRAKKEELFPLHGISIKTMNITPQANPRRNKSSRTSNNTSSQATNERSSSSASHPNQITAEMSQQPQDNIPNQINNQLVLEYDFSAFSKELSNDEQAGQFLRWKEQPKTFKTDPSNLLLPRYSKNGDDTANNSQILAAKYINSAYENPGERNSLGNRDKPKLLNSPFQMFRAKSLNRKKNMLNRLANYSIPTAVQLTEGDSNSIKPSKELVVSSFTSTNASNGSAKKSGIPWIRKVQVGQNNKFMLCLDTKKSFDQTQFYFKKTSEMNVFSPFRNRSTNYKSYQTPTKKQITPQSYPQRMEYSFS